MSASKRLQAIYDHIVSDEDAMGTLNVYARWWPALPEIIGVIKESERQVRESHPDDVDLELSSALAALYTRLSEDDFLPIGHPTC